MITEMTDKNDIRGWVLYDADCPFCCRLANWARRPLQRKRLALEPLQSPWVRQRLQMSDAQLLTEMRLLTAGGECFGGADALLEIAPCFWWAWPLRQIARIPAVRSGLPAMYRWIAAHRGCTGGRCTTQARGRIARPAGARLQDFLPLLLLTIAAVALRPILPRWPWMWAIAVALYIGFKWLSLRLSAGAIRTQSPSRRRLLGYLLAWPGMDASTFVSGQKRAIPPNWREWVAGGMKVAIGAILMWGVVRLVINSHPLIACGIGMAGFVLMLHFGLFDLISLAWRQCGVPAEPVMGRPFSTASLADFWGRRWNRAFINLADRLAFRPLRRRTNAWVALVATFGLSGLLHELVITVPAGGGYGLPTCYFLLQSAGVLIERSPMGRRLRLGEGLRGRMFMLIFFAAPLPMLFPPVFLRHIMMPMFSAIGAG